MASSQGIELRRRSGGWSGLLLFWRRQRVFIVSVAGALLAGVLISVASIFGLLPLLALVGVLVLAIVVVLRLDVMAVILVIALHVYVDYYLRLQAGAIGMGLVLLAVFYLGRSVRRPWVEVPLLSLWVIFLVLTILPAVQGLNIYDYTYYYPNIILGSCVLYWLGALLAARGMACVRSVFVLLALVGTLVAVHTLIQALTGVFLLSSSRYDAFLQQTGNYQLAVGIDTHRVGSFFTDPNWDGTFLATLFFLPLGLFIASSSLRQKIFYLLEMCLILLALLFTYSAGAWTATIVGIIVFILLSGQGRFRVQLLFCVGIAVLGLLIGFLPQVSLLLQHATNPGEASQRLGAWMTALRMIQAFPLTGVGLGHYAYLARSAPYMVPAQIEPLDHPHNSYLELAAMGGVPVLLLFLVLLAGGVWLALRAWRQADAHGRLLIGAGIAAIVALTVNSWTINGWTLPPIGVLGWLILGLIAPVSRRGQSQSETQASATQQGALHGNGLERKNV